VAEPLEPCPSLVKLGVSGYTTRWPDHRPEVSIRLRVGGCPAGRLSYRRHRPRKRLVRGDHDP
jgi:hypothetical protein